LKVIQVYDPMAEGKLPL